MVRAAVDAVAVAVGVVRVDAAGPPARGKLVVEGGGALVVAAGRCVLALVALRRCVWARRRRRCVAVQARRVDEASIARGEERRKCASRRRISGRFTSVELELCRVLC